MFDEAAGEGGGQGLASMTAHVWGGKIVHRSRAGGDFRENRDDDRVESRRDFEPGTLANL
jgi:hypothetical protein